ncbi:cyclic nucleotide-binding domain-containing protein [bacterium]|nr:cyclic nucleotide-binding domain-containing protein [bacterium]
MQDINYLKAINILKPFDHSILEKISDIASVESFQKGDFLYKEGDPAVKLFSIIEGKVGIEVQKSSSSTYRVEDLCQGNTTGISSLVDDDEKKHLFSAHVLAPTKTLVWRAEDLEKLFETNPKIGFTFMKRIAKILKRRLSIKNIQYIDIYK